MADIDKKTWEKTRPSDCKDSGIGGACDAWKKHCATSAEDVLNDDSLILPATTAANSMLEAIKVARGKLAKVKDSDKKKSPTSDLLDDWETQAKDYLKVLSDAPKIWKKREEPALEHLTLRKDMIDVMEKWLKRAQEVSAQVDTYHKMATKHVKEAETHKSEGNVLMTNTSAAVVSRAADETDALLKSLAEDWVAFSKPASGDFMNARGDFKSWPTHWGKQRQSEYTSESGGYWKQIDGIQIQFAGILKSCQTSAGEIRALADEAAIYSTGSQKSAEQYKNDLQKLDGELTKVCKELELIWTKLEKWITPGDRKKEIEALTKTLTESKEKPAVKKQWQMNISGLQTLASKKDTILKQITAIEKRISLIADKVEGDKEFTKLADTLLEKCKDWTDTRASQMATALQERVQALTTLINS